MSWSKSKRRGVPALGDPRSTMVRAPERTSTTAAGSAPPKTLPSTTTGLSKPGERRGGSQLPSGRRSRARRTSSRATEEKRSRPEKRLVASRGASRRPALKAAASSEPQARRPVASTATSGIPNTFGRETRRRAPWMVTGAPRASERLASTAACSSRGAFRLTSPAPARTLTPKSTAPPRARIRARRNGASPRRWNVARRPAAGRNPVRSSVRVRAAAQRTAAGGRCAARRQRHEMKLGSSERSSTCGTSPMSRRSKELRVPPRQPLFHLGGIP